MQVTEADRANPDGSIIYHRERITARDGAGVSCFGLAGRSNSNDDSRYREAVGRPVPCGVFMRTTPNNQRPTANNQRRNGLFSLGSWALGVGRSNPLT
jgi:hypothetical protein